MSIRSSLWILLTILLGACQGTRTHAEGIISGTAAVGAATNGISNIGASSGGGPPLAPLRIVASCGQMPTGNGTIAAANRNTWLSRVPCIFGGNASEIRFCYDNFRLDTDTNNRGTAVDNDQPETILGLGLWDGGTQVAHATFGGLASTVMAPGASEVCTDPILPSAFGLTQFAKDSLFWVQARLSIPGSGLWMIGAHAEYQGINCTGAMACSWLYSTANDIPGQEYLATLTKPTAALNVTPGDGHTYGPGPTAAIGRFVAPGNLSVFVVGDSWWSGTNDSPVIATATGAGIMAHAALTNTFPTAPPLTNTIANTQAVKGGTGIDDYVNKYPAKVTWPMSFANVLITGAGGNDIGAYNLPPATVFSDLQTVWATAKSIGVQRLVTVTMNMRTTDTTGLWETATNQVYSLRFGPGSNAEALNTLLAGALSGTQIDGIIPTTGASAGAVAGVNDIWKWNFTAGTPNAYTLEGLHPESLTACSYCILGGNLRTILLGLTVN